MASLDRLFESNYFGRKELDSISKEGFDPFKNVIQGLVARSPSTSAYRRSAGIPMLEPGGSAPVGWPSANMPPMQEDTITNKVNPDNSRTGLKAIQTGLVPLISDIRVAEGVREAMDLSVPLATLIPHKFSMKSGPNVYPETEVYEGNKDKPVLSLPLTEGVLSKFRSRISPTRSIGDVGFSPGIEDMLFTRREIAMGANRAQPAQTNVQVAAPQINVNARVSGEYSVELMSRDLGFHVEKSLSSSLGRLSTL